MCWGLVRSEDEGMGTRSNWIMSRRRRLSRSKRNPSGNRIIRKGVGGSLNKIHSLSKGRSRIQSNNG